MHYRSEIDGLRAIAVIPVILFHAGFTVFSGGYVGVDVFFVISGYLITTIIIHELELGKFSILRFYERRARRILPALFFVMLWCIPVAWLSMQPSQFKDFGQSVAAVSVFVSNMLFWKESGYFAADAAEKPLLHTWSLAVEEQYYLFFPIFLILLWRFGRKPVFYSIVAISIASLLSSEWGSRHIPSANFYLAPMRAWELLAGSICAFRQYGKAQRSNQTLAAIGLALIVFAIVYYDERTPFPSMYALGPVVGTALIIMYGSQGTRVAQLLSTKPFVGVGLVSYSAYLWHQPLFATARIRSIKAPEQWLMVLLAAAALVLAYFSWRYVEQPVRRKGSGIFATQKTLFLLSATGSFSFVLFGIAGHLGVPPYIAIVRPELFTEYEAQMLIGEPCEGFTVVEGDASCLRYGHGDHRTVVWGDSHADHLAQGVKLEQNRSVYIVSHTGCPPIVHVMRDDEIGSSMNCRDINTTYHYAEFIESLDPDDVVLVGRWTLYLRGWHRNGRLQAASHFVTDGVVDHVDPAISQGVFINGMRETIELLSSFSPVLIVAQVPDLNMFSEKERLLLESVPASVINDWHSVEESAFENISETSSVSVLDTKKIFCSDVECYLRRDGYRMYADDNHLSTLGEEMLWSRIVSALKGSEPPSSRQ